MKDSLTQRGKKTGRLMWFIAAEHKGTQKPMWSHYYSRSDQIGKAVGRRKNTVTAHGEWKVYSSNKQHITTHGQTDRHTHTQRSERHIIRGRGETANRATQTWNPPIMPSSNPLCSLRSPIAASELGREFGPFVSITITYLEKCCFRPGKNMNDTITKYFVALLYFTSEVMGT